MARKHRAHDDKAWTNAKKICRLTRRQVEMARALGMNPRKLPGLRPSPQQRWKLPVGEFIEECYRKRFGGDPRDRHAPGPRLPPPVTNRDPDVPEPVRDHEYQLSDLACYLINLADDLQYWLSHGSIDPRVLGEVRDELKDIAKALDAGEPISPFPAISLPPRPTGRCSPPRDRRESALDDEEIPF
jgi:hypothetical protein